MTKLNLQTVVAALVASGLGLSATGCIVAGYSSRGGGFIFPGGLGLVVIILVIVFLMRRR